MSLEIRNYCAIYHDRICPAVQEILTRAYVDLDLAGFSVMIYFVDFEPQYGEYRLGCRTGEYKGGFHEWGIDGSIIHVEVAHESLLPDPMLIWLTLHEMRHANQSFYDKFNSQEDEENFKKLLAAEGLDVPTPDFMRAHHDDFPEERDADEWATMVTKFNGNQWWSDVFEQGKRPSLDDYFLE